MKKKRKIKRTKADLIWAKVDGPRNKEIWQGLHKTLRIKWRCDREADGVALEKRSSRKATVGSNPTFSAILIERL